MDKLVPEMYRDYGKYINAFRAFPLDVDGLKPVERRVLLTAFIVAKKKLVKCAEVDGTCTAKFHPHGSAYGTIVQMVRQGFLIGQGNFGNNLGVEPSPPAAMRYTECMMPEKTIDLMFKYINNVPWVESEMKDEPLYLPTMFPIALLGNEYTQGIGFGYKTTIPCYTMNDLLKRLEWLLKIRKRKPIIKPITDCKILSTDEELEVLLSKGKATIQLQGIIQIDRTRNKVYVKSWPPGRRFESVLTKFKAEMDVNDIGIMDLSNKANGTHIEFSVLKQRNRDKIFKKFLKKLKTVVTGTIAFEMNVVGSDGNVRTASVDELLLNTYQMFVDTNKIMLEEQIRKYSDSISENQLLELIKPHLADMLKKGEKNVPAIIKYISEKTKITGIKIKEIFSKYNINKLLSVSTDISEIQAKKKGVEADLKNLTKFVLKQYVDINK